MRRRTFLAVGAASAAAIREVVAGVDRAISGLPPHARAETVELFALLALAPARRAFAGVAAETLALTGLSVAIVEEGPLRSSSDFRMREAEA